MISPRIGVTNLQNLWKHHPGHDFSYKSIGIRNIHFPGKHLHQNCPPKLVPRAFFPPNLVLLAQKWDIAPPIFCFFLTSNIHRRSLEDQPLPKPRLGCFHSTLGWKCLHDLPSKPHVGDPRKIRVFWAVEWLLGVILEPNIFSIKKRETFWRSFSWKFTSEKKQKKHNSCTTKHLLIVEAGIHPRKQNPSFSGSIWVFLGGLLARKSWI